jgi:hypothetical protein
MRAIVANDATYSIFHLAATAEIARGSELTIEY